MAVQPDFQPLADDRSANGSEPRQAAVRHALPELRQRQPRRAVRSGRGLISPDYGCWMERRTMRFGGCLWLHPPWTCREQRLEHAGAP